MKNIVNNKNLNVIMVLLSGVLWGTIGLYTTSLKNSGLDTVTITAIRSLLTAILLGIFMLCFNPALFKIRLKSLWSFFGMSVISFSFFNICYFKSMQYNSLGTACILLYTAPVFVMLMSAILFKEKLNTIKLFCLALAIIGCFLVSGADGKIHSIGIIFGICSGFGYALYSIFSVYALKENHFFTSIFYAFSLSAICLAPFCDWKLAINTVSAKPDTMLWLIGIAFFTTVLPYILYTCGLRTVPAGEASVIACVEPLVANLVGFLVFNQIPTLSAVCGIILILTAVIVLGLQKPIKS